MKTIKILLVLCLVLLFTYCSKQIIEPTEQPQDTIKQGKTNDNGGTPYESDTTWFYKN